MSDVLFSQTPSGTGLIFGDTSTEVLGTDLVFSQPPGSTALLFGAEGSAPAPSVVTAHVSVQVPTALQVQALVMQPVRVHAQVVIGRTLTVQCSVEYDNRSTPYLEVFAGSAMQKGVERGSGFEVPWGSARPQRPVTAAPHALGQAACTQGAVVHGIGRGVESAPSAPYTQAQGVTARTSLSAMAGVPVWRTASGLHTTADQRQYFVLVPNQTGLAKHCTRKNTWAKATPWNLSRTGSARLGAPFLRRSTGPWGLAGAAPHGKELWPPPKPMVPPPPVWGSDLVFACPPLALPHLVFGATCEQEPPVQSLFYILPARFYMAVHHIAAYLLPGLEQVPIFDLSLAADVDSTVWTFSASTQREYFDALAPTSGTPRQIRVVADTMEWVFLVDSLKQTESFGKRRTSISGRSATALVGEPYSRATQRLSTTVQSAQQLASAALQYSGVGLDFGLTDWLVASGAWSHTGTPLAAVQAIAQAAGAHVQSHRSQPTLLVRHPYPMLPGGILGGPWNWDGVGGVFAPDVALAPDVILSRSVERADGADIDGVYVAGTVTGAVEALVRRSGTAGAKLAVMQTDALITDMNAAQQRGLAVLGAGGPKHKVQLTMPVLMGGANPGLLDVGQLVQINDTAPWRGRVRAVQMQYSAPTLRQTVTLERHLA